VHTATKLGTSSEVLGRCIIFFNRVNYNELREIQIFTPTSALPVLVLRPLCCEAKVTFLESRNSMPFARFVLGAGTCAETPAAIGDCSRGHHGSFTPAAAMGIASLELCAKACILKCCLPRSTAANTRW
jgi:hypothetical protein